MIQFNHSFFPQISINSVLSLSTPTSSCWMNSLILFTNTVRISQCPPLHYRKRINIWKSSPVILLYVLLHLILVTDHDQPHLGVHLVHQQLVLNEQLVKYSQDLHKVQFNNHRCLLFSLGSVWAELCWGLVWRRLGQQGGQVVFVFNNSLQKQANLVNFHPFYYITRLMICFRLYSTSLWVFLRSV